MRQQRIVILPGPHKTGTTSVQNYIVELKEEEKLGSWLWPARDAKSLAPLASFVLFHKRKHEELVKRKATRIAKAWSNGQSIVIGAELLDYIAALPSKSPAHQAFERLQSILPDSKTSIPEVSVMYRTPRVSHLISIWKQQLTMAARGNKGKPWRFRLLNDAASTTETGTDDAPSLSKWLCHGQWGGSVGIGFNVQEILASQANPIGIANAFATFAGWNVTIVDMSGIEDLPNTVACEILGVPCTNNNKVVGYENEDVLTLAKRSNPTSLGFSSEDMNEVEDILRMMDCYYYCELRDNISILHGTDEMFVEQQGWKGCCKAPEKWLPPAQAYEMLRNLGCRSSSQNKAMIQPERTENATIIGNYSLNDNQDREKKEIDSGSTEFDSQYAAILFFMAVTVTCFRVRRKRRAKQANLSE